MVRTNYAGISGMNRKSRKTALTPQSQPIPGREAEMIVNPAGGYSFALDEFGRLNRFLILGSDSNTYYQTKATLVKENAKVVQEAIRANPTRVVDMVVDVASNGRSFRQDAPLFVLAMVAAYENPDKNEELRVRKYALDSLPKVALTATHLYKFAGFVQEMRGWGRGLRNAFRNWYFNMPVQKLAMQAWKYKSREGWSHRDVLRLAHLTKSDYATIEPDRADVFRYIAKPDGSFSGNRELRDRVLSQSKIVKFETSKALAQIAAAEEVLHLEGTDSATVKKAVKLIRDHRLTHEAVPGHLKNVPEVWDALLAEMPVIATLRNLGKMTSVGLIKPLSAAERVVLDRLGNAEQIERSRAHPIQFLIAAKQYSVGHGERGSLSWTPSQSVVEALDEAFYASFGNVEPVNGSVLLAVDVSGSMSTHTQIMGLNWSPLELAGAMATVYLGISKQVHWIGFDTVKHELPVRKKMRIDAVMRELRKYQGGATDTAAPIHYLNENKMKADAIISFTDNCTWAGGYWGASRSGHVAEVFRNYTAKFGPSRFVNMAVTANSATDVDPTRSDMFEMCGFDADAPKVVGEFITGRI